MHTGAGHGAHVLGGLLMVVQRSTRSFGKGFGALNCPGDPGCPGYVDPSVNQAIQAAIADAGGLPVSYATPAPGGYGTPYGTPAAPSSVSWMQQASWAIYAGAAVLLLLAIGGKR